MWSITQVKEAAKDYLWDSYWLAFALCLVAGVLTSAGNISFQFTMPMMPFGEEPEAIALFLVFSGVFMIISLVLWAFSMAFIAFISNPLFVGQKRYFVVGGLTGENKFGYLFSVFKRGEYLAVVKTMILKDLFVGLWTLLFIIPGIIKGYAWRMVPYILAQDPTMPYKEALQLSERMTDGEKLSMFVLDLSFIGWWLLGTLACGIGSLFVVPYYEATWTQLYFVLSEKIEGESGYAIA